MPRAPAKSAFYSRRISAHFGTQKLVLCCCVLVVCWENLCLRNGRGNRCARWSINPPRIILRDIYLWHLYCVFITSREAASLSLGIWRWDVITLLQLKALDQALKLHYIYNAKWTALRSQSDRKYFPADARTLKWEKLDARKIRAPYAGCFFPENYPVKQQESVVAKRPYFTHAVIDSWIIKARNK
jgi:hypothetical protein